MGPLTPRNPRLRAKYPYNDMVWKKLDPDTKGFAEIKQVIKYADDVEMCCPGLVDRFQEVATNGKLTKGAFDNYGKPTDRAKHRAKRAKRHDLGELRQLFDTIVKAGEKDIKLADLVRHKREVNRICPELITEFSDIDQDNSCSVSWDELRVFAGGTDDWLKFQLQNIIGLDGLKDQIHQFHQSISLDKKRQAAGFDVKDAGGKYHMIFQGNPGTGKTTMGRVVAALLKRIGITASDLLVEVQRDQLVAGYVGQTAPKTQEKIDEAIQGVLFVDEAYRLSQGSKSGSDYGKEAIETLMGAMTEPPGKAPVMVFAGYPNDMDQFMQANSGLYRRIAYTFDFEDYTPLDLAKILGKMAQGKGFGLSADLTANNFEVLARMIEEGTLPEARALMNGGICERIFTFAKQSLDGRCQASGQVSVEITAEDITMAMTRIPPPPRRDDGGDDDGGGGGGGGGGDERLRLELTNVKQQLVLVKQQLRMARADSSRLKGELDRTKALLASRPAAPPPAARAPQAPQAPPANQAPPAGAGHAAVRAGGAPAAPAGVWQVLLESGWATIDAAGQHILNGAVAAGQTSIRDKIAGREYFIDFVAKKQTNCRTGKARDIRCAPAGGAAAPAAKPSEAGGTWQIMLNDGWKVMDAPTSAALSQAAKAGQTKVQLRQRGYDYTVDLAALTQTNLATKAVRQIRFF